MGSPSQGKALRAVSIPLGLRRGTAFFPGGSGLWRGEEPFGALPEHFPERTVMFVAHNFDKNSSYQKSLTRGSEVLKDLFWVYMRAYITEAGLSESQCFFTNALMGLQPLKATAPMDTAPLFREQCRALMQKQIAIVKPRCIAILGDDATEELRNVTPTVSSDTLRHPSWLKYQKSEERPTIITEQAAKLKRLFGGVP